MRSERFRSWIIDLVKSNAPEAIQVQTWAESGITDLSGMAYTFGFTFTSPAGGRADLMWVHGAPPGGYKRDQDEHIVEGEPPAPVSAVQLALAPGGKLSMRDLEQWLHALIINSRSREIASIEAYSDRPAERAGTHPYGLTITWHNGGQAYAHLWHTLSPGEQRGDRTAYRILEAV